MRRKVFMLGLYIFGITLLQSTILNYVKIYNVKPNLFIIFIVAVALMRGNIEGAVVGFVCGIMQDISAGKVIGFYALMGIYLGLAVGSVNKRLYKENIFVIMFFTFISTVAYEGIVYFVNALILREDINLVYSVVQKILPEALYNSIISIFIYVLVSRLYDRLKTVNKLARKY